MMAATLAPMSSAHKNKVFRSGDLTVYPQLGQVEIQGQIIRLALVNMQVLVTLLEHAGEVVSRADFFDRVWKNQTVSDDTLTRCISELRTQLSKHSSHSSLIAADLDDVLKDQLLATDHLRFFAPSAVRNGSQKSFPYLSREFGAQWIIEGDIRQKQDKFRVSLSLVDAKTALVVYSLTQALDNDPAQLEQMCSVFIAEISQALHLDGKE